MKNPQDERWAPDRVLVVLAGLALLGVSAVASLAAPPRLSRSAFVQQANAICAHTAKRVYEMPQPQTAEEALKQLDTDRALLGRLVRQVQQLRPPISIEPDVAAMLDAFREMNTALKQGRAALLQGDAAALDAADKRFGASDQRAKKLAYRIGLAACAGEFRPGTKVYRIPSSAMEPTLHCARPGSGCEARVEDHVRARPLRSDEPKRFDILVFKTPPLAKLRCGAGGTFVKRLVGLPGETLEEKNGFVFIDGKKLLEPYVKADRRDTAISYPARKILPGMYFMMGDNRTQSCDSREWGPVPRKNIVGKLIAILRGSITITYP